MGLFKCIQDMTVKVVQAVILLQSQCHSTSKTYLLHFLFALLKSGYRQNSKSLVAPLKVTIIINFNKDQAWFPTLLAISCSFVTVDKDIRRQGVCLRSLTEKIEEKTLEQYIG